MDCTNLIKLPCLLADGAADGAGHAADSLSGGSITLMLILTVILIILNGFFVAAEFALVKVRLGQVKKMVEQGKPFAKAAYWLAQRLDQTLSACQLGITIASLALGRVGEPAVAKLVEPVFHLLGIESEQLLHTFAFIIAFSAITALHLVIGEQAPKIYAIRRPKQMILWCAAPMVFFYYLLLPFLVVLNWVTSVILGWLGLSGDGGHDTPHNEEEIRALVREAHIHGHLTGSEHRLLNAIFEFDDLLCRLVMVPRNEIDFLDVNKPFPELLKYAIATKHTRYPLCDGSLDSLLGVIHMKDLLGVDPNDASFDLKTIMRTPVKVPENMLISRVLQRIQTHHQLLTFVVDEYGTLIGIVTLENVLEKIIGPVDDEFDTVDQPNVKQISESEYLVAGSTPVGEVERELGIELNENDFDTAAGVLMSKSGRLPREGDLIEFDGVTAKVEQVANDHTELIRFTLSSTDGEASES
jgi:CBS domain containing-hemolysin-like protein